MPYYSAPACVLGDCSAPSFPVTAAACECTQSVGGIAEVYFIPCTETLSQVNVTNPVWWQGLVTANTLGRSGAGLGKLGKKSSKSERISSCLPEEITSLTWALNFVTKCFDKTSDDTTTAKFDEILQRGKKYLVVARMCEGEERVMPIGITSVTDFDYIIPDNFEDKQSAMFELSFMYFGLPGTVVVPGLAAIVPKAA